MQVKCEDSAKVGEQALSCTNITPCIIFSQLKNVKDENFIFYTYALTLVGELRLRDFLLIVKVSYGANL